MLNPDVILQADNPDMAVELPGSEEEGLARTAIAQAQAALKERRGDIPPAFVAQLFGQVVPEDVVRYAATDLATLAERAFDLLAERPAGSPKISCDTLELKDSRRTVTVVQIVNDDMPFLVDSVMGELADRKLAVWMVAHRVLGVQGKDGKLAGKLVALGTPEAAGNARESFIHIHVDPIADGNRADLVDGLNAVLSEVRLAVQDWRAMLERINGVIA